MKTQISDGAYGAEGRNYQPGGLTGSTGCYVPEMIRSKTVTVPDPGFNKTGNYRVLIDPEGVGHIRIVRRINIRTFILVFWDVYRELEKNPDRKPQIIIYLSRSLSVEMSETLRIFLDFSIDTTGGIFELRTIE